MRKGFTLIELLVVIAIIAILAAILFPVFGKAREKARQTHCTNNQKSFGTAVQIYTQEHEETLPAIATFWGDLRVDKATLKCMTKPSLDNGYVYNYKYAGKGLGEIRDNSTPPKVLDPTTVFLTADGQHKTASSDGLLANVAYLDGDIEVRHNGKAIVSYLDGHVDMVNQAGADALTEDSGVGGGPLPATVGVAKTIDSTWTVPATWTVTDPTGGSHTPATIPAGPTAAITFGTAGTYTVVAKNTTNPALTLTWTVTVAVPDPLPVVSDFTAITNLATFTAGTSATKTFFTQGGNTGSTPATGGNPGSYVTWGNYGNQIIIALPAPSAAETWKVSFDSKVPSTWGGPNFKVYGLTNGQTMAYAYGGGSGGTKLFEQNGYGTSAGWTPKNYTVNVTPGYNVIVLQWFIDGDMSGGHGIDNLKVTL